ncbi:MAG TPA: helix-turn-helix domain-containing protein [Candidatus Elarobacter sp.]|jgi:AcrR family transcriptional regulator
MLNAQRNHAGVEETRARILAAARDLFETRGTRGTTTREVAERAGVNEATLFRHFGSKSALLIAMREAACDNEPLRATLAALDGVDVQRDLVQVAEAAVERMLDRRAMMCVSLAEDATGTDDGPVWRGPAQSLEDVADYFRARVAEGRMQGDPLMLGRMFLGILFSYVVGRKLWEGSALDRTALIEAVVTTFLNGARK